MCAGVTDRYNPSSVKYFYTSGEFITHSVRVVTSICPHPIFQDMLSHLAAGELCNGARMPGGKKTLMFSIMVDSR